MNYKSWIEPILAINKASIDAFAQIESIFFSGFTTKRNIAMEQTKQQHKQSNQNNSKGQKNRNKYQKSVISDN